MSKTIFDQQIQEALAFDFSGWDFSWARGRWQEDDPAWNYPHLVQERIQCVDSLLDMGTGGGEFLASLPHRPAVTYATESYLPNVPIARARLELLGVRVLACEDDSKLPLPDAAVELAINRHASYWMPEVHRILKPGGIFLTQQVGPLNCIEINRFMGAPVEPDVAAWTLEQEVTLVAEAGFQVRRAEEVLLDSIFYDIGAVILYLKIIEWQIPDFSVQRYRKRLFAMHELIEAEGAFHAQAHRFLIEVQKL